MEGATVKPAPLWANRDFTVFWCGQTLSELGNAFALVALPLLVLDATGSVARMGLLTASRAPRRSSPGCSRASWSTGCPGGS